MSDTAYSNIHNRRSSFVTAAWLAFIFIFALAACFEYADDMSVFNRFGGARSGFYLTEDADDDLDDSFGRFCADPGGRARQKLAYYLETPDMSVAYQVNPPPARLSANGDNLASCGFAERKVVKIRDNLDDGGNGSDSVSLGFAREDYGRAFEVKTAADFSGGNGTEENPYLISSAEELFELSLRVSMNGKNNGQYYRSAHYRQIKNIDLAKITNWWPIGNNTVIVQPDGLPINMPFIGVFDGAGYAISNIRFDLSEASFENLGLFGVISGGGAVKNVNLANPSYVNGDGIKKVRHFGLIAGELRGGGVIDNCTTSGESFNLLIDPAEPISNIEDPLRFGGIVGIIEHCEVKNCQNAIKLNIVSVTNKIRVYIGGIAGSSVRGSIIENCVNMGEISLSGYASIVSGIAGLTHQGEIIGCLNTAEIKVNTPSSGQVGGISAELAFDVKMRQCVNKGSIYVNAAGFGITCGGLVGRISDSSSIAESFNSGSIALAIDHKLQNEAPQRRREGSYVPQPDYVVRIRAGGVVGNVEEGDLADSYNIGDIKGTVSATGRSADIYIGGIAGLSRSKLSRKITYRNSYNAGTIQAVPLSDTQVYLGGVIGYMEEEKTDITRCYWLKDENISTAVGKEKAPHLLARLYRAIFGDPGNMDMPPLTKEELTRGGVIEGWDFETIWIQKPNGPELRNVINTDIDNVIKLDGKGE